MGFVCYNISYWKKGDKITEEKKMSKKQLIPVGVALLLIAGLIVYGVSTGMLSKYSYSDEEMDMNDYFQIFRPDALALILEDEVIEEQGLVQEETYYLPLGLVQDKFNSRFYYDKAESQILYTTPTQFYQIPLDASAYQVDGETKEFDHIIAIRSEETVYLSIDYLKQFANFSYEAFDEPNRLQLYLKDSTADAATIRKDTNLRYQGGVKSDILEELYQDEVVTVLETMEKWSKVKSSDSVIGYVENKYLTDETTVDRKVEKTYEEPEYTSIHKEEKINLAWHQVTTQEANSGVSRLLETTKGINVISPTWFYLQSDEGDIASVASADYVADMHSRGIDVWGLVDNFTSKDYSMAKVLGSTSARRNLIGQLIEKALEYDLDGINVDFESIDAECGEDYIQLLRELSIECRKNELVLSVDNYVPTSFTAHYNRKEQGMIVDYVIIMGYDEHYAGSPEAGSVASIDYVQQGIIDTVEAVPEEKVINGIPFYTRIWDVTGDVTSEAVGMAKAKEFLQQNGVEATWDDETCQNVAKFTADGRKYAVWMEDDQSIRAKLSVMKQYRLAGVAEWKLGFETPDIWDLIVDYLKDTDTFGTGQTEAESVSSNGMQQTVSANGL
jgi:spore germination protein YaaH